MGLKVNASGVWKRSDLRVFLVIHSTVCSQLTSAVIPSRRLPSISRSAPYVHATVALATAEYVIKANKQVAESSCHIYSHCAVNTLSRIQNNVRSGMFSLNFTPKSCCGEKKMI